MAGRVEIRIEIPGFLQAMAQLAQALGRAVEDFCSTAQLVDTFRESFEAEHQRFMERERRFPEVIAQVHAGIITFNEARALLDLPALEEERGTADPSVAEREERRQRQAEIEVRQRLGMTVSMTQEDRDRIDRAFQDYLREEDKKLQERQAAQRKAGELLMSCLDEGQKMTFEADGFFDVRGQDGKLYRIFDSSVFNVIRIGRSTRFCAQLVKRPDLGHVPLYDQMLAQKLCLETDIERFMAVSNKSENPPEPSRGGYTLQRFIP